jgi:hypothetical protein
VNGVCGYKERGRVGGGSVVFLKKLRLSRLSSVLLYFEKCSVRSVTAFKDVSCRSLPPRHMWLELEFSVAASTNRLRQRYRTGPMLGANTEMSIVVRAYVMDFTKCHLSNS